MVRPVYAWGPGTGAQCALLEHLQELAKLGLVVLIWACCHHFCAGIRYLALDLNKGISLRPARVSSAVVIVASLALTAFFASKLW